MLWLWIIGGIVGGLALLGLVRLGVLVAIDGTAAAWVTVGPVRIQVAPSKKGKRKPADKKSVKKTPETGNTKKNTIPKPTKEDLRSALDTLGPRLKRALRRTRRSIRIHPMQLSVTIGGANDPAAAAEIYGLVHSAVWAGMPLAEELLVIPAPGIHIDLDFDAPTTRIQGDFGVSIRIGTLFGIGLTVGVSALIWIVKFWKRRSGEPSTAKETDCAAEKAAS